MIRWFQKHLNKSVSFLVLSCVNLWHLALFILYWGGSTHIVTWKLHGGERTGSCSLNDEHDRSSCSGQRPLVNLGTVKFLKEFLNIYLIKFSMAQGTKFSMKTYPKFHGKSPEGNGHPWGARCMLLSAYQGYQPLFCETELLDNCTFLSCLRLRDGFFVHWAHNKDILVFLQAVQNDSGIFWESTFWGVFRSALHLKKLIMEPQFIS